jgi:hypothetical protein
MHSRLLPLTPAPFTATPLLPRFALHRITLPSMPWLEVGFFTVMILGLIAVGA